ncbi:MAG: SPOCS domain-containing protein [Lachnospiraceae bacterium]
MDLLKKTITYGTGGECLTTQLTFDDDINVSDQNADIRNIVMQNGHVHVDEIRSGGGKIRMSGHLEFSVLYTSEEHGELSCIHGDFAFEDTVNYDGCKDGEKVTVLWSMEDLSAQMIHPRKMNVKAVVTFNLYPICLSQEETAVGVSYPSDAETLAVTEQFTGLQICGKDTLRIKELFDLPGGKPDIDRVIFQNLRLHNVKTRAENGFLSISGDLSLFLMYRSADDHMPIQWVERQIAVGGQIESPHITDLMLSASCVQLAHTEISAEEDEDGEMRQISVEAVLQCDLILFEEQRMEFLEDVYVPEMEFSITRPETDMIVLDSCNDSRMKMNFNMPLHAQKPLVQIIDVEAAVKVEDYHPGEEGLVLEGIISVELLYQQADQENPYDSRHQEYPFSYIVQSQNGGNAGRSELLRISSSVEQVNAVLAGADEVEIRLTAGFCIAFCSRKSIRMITEIDMKPVPAEKIDDMPGIAGYVVRPQDTLWSVARKFYVSLASVREVNELNSDDLKPGQKLLIVK